MEIAGFSTLTEAQCAEIAALQSASLSPEELQNGVWLSNEMNFDRAVPCFFLGREDTVLVSFLTLFLPTRLEGEVTGFTLPAMRQRGLFTALLHRAGAVLQNAGVPNFLLATEPESRGAAALLKRFPTAVFSHAEYRMTRAADTVPLPKHFAAARVTAETVGEFVEMIQAEYGGEERAEAVLSAEDRKSYLLFDGKRAVGTFALTAGDAHTTLCGVALPERLRGRGYGKAIVRAAINLAARDGKSIELDVDSENPVALGLYRSFGFAPTFTVEYRRVPVADVLR